MINRLPLEFRLPNGVAAATSAKLEPSRFSAASERVLRNAGHCVGSYPVASLATAFVGGLLFGRWIKAK